MDFRLHAWLRKLLPTEPERDGAALRTGSGASPGSAEHHFEALMHAHRALMRSLQGGEGGSGLVAGKEGGSGSAPQGSKKRLKKKRKR